MKVKASTFVENSLNIIGEGLFSCRQTKGLSLQEVFEKTGMPVADIEKIELGRFKKNELVDLDQIFGLIDFYDAHIEINLFGY